MHCWQIDHITFISLIFDSWMKFFPSSSLMCALLQMLDNLMELLFKANLMTIFSKTALPWILWNTYVELWLVFRREYEGVVVGGEGQGGGGGGWQGGRGKAWSQLGHSAECRLRPGFLNVPKKVSAQQIADEITLSLSHARPTAQRL